MGCLSRIGLAVVVGAAVIAIVNTNAGAAFALVAIAGVIVGLVGRRLYG